MPVDVPATEWESLEYMDWKSGGDTNFAPIASADGELDCRWLLGQGQDRQGRALDLERRDRADPARLRRCGRRQLRPGARHQARAPRPRAAIRSIHRDDNNRFNPDGEGWVVRSWVELTDHPDSYMLLMDNGPTACPTRRPNAAFRSPKGARFVVDTQRLWHVVVHDGDQPRYALITSFESRPGARTVDRRVSNTARTCVSPR